MSIPTDDMTDQLDSPTMGLAMGLLSAGGPSRMPVSLGQALAQGVQSERDYAAQDQMRQYQMMLALARLQQMQRMAPQGQSNVTPGGGQ